MTDPTRLDTEQPHTDRPPAETHAATDPGAWYRTPLALVAGLILFIGALALVVLAVTGGDDDDVATDPVAVAAADAEGAALPVITFGGPGIPETDAVILDGEALPPLAPEGPDEAIGTLAPAVTVTSLANGSSIRLEPGRARVIGFFAHWCPHCQQELPEITEWLSQNELPPNTEFVAVSTAVDEGAGNYPPSDWFTDVGWVGPVVVDDPEGTLLRGYGFGGFPAFVAIDASGTVVARESGNIGVEGLERLFANFAR